MYNCKQKDRGAIAELCKKVHATKIPDSRADDKTMIQALIKGLTPGPTASHLTRNKSKSINQLFMN
jgi:hypothetical protein